MNRMSKCCWKKLVLISSLLICQVKTSAIPNDDNSQKGLPLSAWNDLEPEVRNIVSNVPQCNDENYSCEKPYRRLCSCHENCMIYADCCPEIMHDRISAGENISAYNFSCIPSGHEKKNEGHLMISSCQETYFNTNLEDLCHKKVPVETYDYTLDLPVISLSSKLTYQNYHCAACNNDSNNLANSQFLIGCEGDKFPQERNAVTGALQMNISDVTKLEYIRNRLEWNINNTSIFPQFSSFAKVTCKLNIVELLKSNEYIRKYGGRKCYIPDGKALNNNTVNEIGRCSQGWTNEYDIAKCRSYSLLLTDAKTTITYKNPHCAICNFANISSENMSCSNPTRGGGITFNRVPMTPSISLLFNTRNAFKCRSGEIWDALDNRCRSAGCGSSFHKVGEKCMRRNRSPDAEITKANCSEEYSVKDSYYIVSLNNSTLNDTLYENGLYEVNISDNFACRPSRKKRHFPVNDSSSLSFFLIATSVVCLAIHIILFYARPKEKSWNSRNLNCLAISLFFAQLIFMFGVTYTENFNLCLIISVCLHFFWLATFFWMNILSIDVFKTFRSQTGILAATAKYKTFIRYNIYGWGTPFAIVGASLTINSFDVQTIISPRYVELENNMLCWINNPVGLIAFFIVPVAIMVVVNFILFIATSWEIYKQYKQAKFAVVSKQKTRTVSKNSMDKEILKKRQRKNKIRMAVYLKLGILQGVTWSLVILTLFINSIILDRLFSICNSLQGALIFICFDLKPVWIKAAWNRVSSMTQVSKGSSSGSTKDTNTSLVLERGRQQ